MSRILRPRGYLNTLVSVQWDYMRSMESLPDDSDLSTPQRTILRWYGPNILLHYYIVIHLHPRDTSSSPRHVPTPVGTGTPVPPPVISPSPINRR